MSVDLLQQMLRIRRFEEACAEQYSAGKIRGFLHLYIGEEAVAAGAMPAIAADDAVVSTYREHGHALARGVPASALMAEMFGKQEGCCRGRGGSMHLFDAARRFYGGHAIVAGGLPIAVGLALADRVLRRTARLTACFFGDGAVAEGEFHESMNLAALWTLPVLFICENNLYAMGTHITRALANVDLPARARTYGMQADSCDGMDVLSVRDAAVRAAAIVRQGTPYFLECRTYRFRGHSMFDAELYRGKAEVAEWKTRDPIPRLAAGLKAKGELTDERWAAIQGAVDAEMQEAVACAERGTLEPIDRLTSDVYTQRSTASAATPS